VSSEKNSPEFGKKYTFRPCFKKSSSVFSGGMGIYPSKFRTWDYSEKNSPKFGAEKSEQHVFKKPSSVFSGAMGIEEKTAKNAQATPRIYRHLAAL
jgi:hypothetical protein